MKIAFGAEKVDASYRDVRYGKNVTDKTKTHDVKEVK